MSSSLTSTRLAASPSGMKVSAAATRRAPGRRTRPRQRGHDRADAAGGAGLVDHQRPGRWRAACAHDPERQRRQPAQVEHAARDARPGRAARAARSDMCRPLAKRHDEHVVASRTCRGLAERHALRRAAGTATSSRSSPGSCRSACGTARSVRGTRTPCRRSRAAASAGAQHRRRVVAARRRGDDQARDVAQHAERVVVVEVAAEALLVAVAGDAHDHRVAELAVARRTQRRRLAAQLVLGVVQVGEVLDLRDRQAARTARRRAPGRGSSARRAACRTRARRRPRAAGPGSRRRRRPCGRRPRRTPAPGRRPRAARRARG